MTASTPASCKDKGRRFQQEVAAQIRATFDLPEADVISRPMGSPGADIILSSAAQAKFPFAVECKRAETWELREWWHQAHANSTDTTYPLLVFRRSRAKTYAIVKTRDCSVITQKWQAKYPGRQGNYNVGIRARWCVEKWMGAATVLARAHNHEIPTVSIINEPLDDNLTILYFADLLIILRDLAELAARGGDQP